MKSYHYIKILFPAILFLVYAAAIIYITWPWANTFATHVLKHWDPPFHAWKLEYAARQLLAGNILPPFGNTNMYYPYSGAFYYEALHWPQAVFAAPLLSLGFNPVLVYHITLVSFWALSGVCFWALLRALGLRNLAAGAGGLFFVLIPYRVSYMPEFNMQLNFGLPLFFYFLIRFFQATDAGKHKAATAAAIGMALALWLQAVSELYQAVFLLFVAPFFVCAMMSGRWRLLKNLRGFWLPLVTAAALCAALSLPFLWPYFTTLQSNTLSRGLDEINTHILEPLSYLVTYNGGLFGHLNARVDEMSVYPTITVLALAILFGLHTFVRSEKNKRTIFFTLVFAAPLVLFFIIVIGLYNAPETFKRFAKLHAILPLLATLLLFPFLLWRRADSATSAPLSTSRAFVRGLFAAALFSFFMSFGPRIICQNAAWGVGNKLFLFLYEHIGALRGFRVVSRFSIFVMMALIIAACYGLELLRRIHACKGAHTATRRIAVIAVVVALAALFAGEIKPPEKRLTVTPLDVPLESAVLDSLDARPEPFVLAMVPMGDRNIDSQLMLQAARHNRLSVWAWGGAYPQYTTLVGGALARRHNHPARFGADLLRQLWPEALILEDKQFSPDRAYARKFADETEILSEDGRYILMRLKADISPKTEIIKLIRYDYAKANPVAGFTVTTAADDKSIDTVYLECNGVPVKMRHLPPEYDGSAKSTTFEADIPPNLITPNTDRKSVV